MSHAQQQATNTEISWRHMRLRHNSTRRAPEKEAFCKISHLPAAACGLLRGLEDVGDNWEAECCGLARPCLGTGHQVPPRQTDGNGVLLHWGWLGVVAANRVCCQCLGQLGLFKTAD